MSFTRTNSGVSNMRLFYDADIVIYTEGGSSSFSISEVEDGKFNSHSVDIKFWNGVLKANNFNKKVQFKAIGSKTASQAITKKILNGDVKNIAIAKDRDLDQFSQELIDSPFILYTKGYSWENDVFAKELTLAQIESMILEANIPEEVISIVDISYNNFRVVGKSLVKLEILFRSRGVGFICDMNGERFFKKNSPYIDTNQVLNIINEKKQLVERPLISGLKLKNICPFMNNYGKLIEALSISVISCVCRKFSDNKSIPKQIIESAMIERFSQKLIKEKDHYYSELVQRLQSA